jgi:branched-chain amino acid transport system substrate-binding protein
VDLIVSGYATPIIAATLPLAMQHDMVLMGLFGLANNAKLKYDKYFGVAPIGEDPANVAAKPFFDVADTLNPKPSTIAVITPDIQFGHAVLEGARNAAQARGMKIVYDRTFPPSMTDFSTGAEKCKRPILISSWLAPNPASRLTSRAPSPRLGSMRS